MKLPLEPLGAYVLAERLQTDSATQLVLPQELKSPYLAHVCAVGPLVDHVERGDRIVFKEKSELEVYLEAKTYILVREADIIARLTR